MRVSVEFLSCSHKYYTLGSHICSVILMLITFEIFVLGTKLLDTCTSMSMHMSGQFDVAILNIHMWQNSKSTCDNTLKFGTHIYLGYLSLYINY